MILPNKDTTLTQSYIGLSALILDILRDREMTFDEIWEEFNKKYVETEKIKSPPSLKKVVMVLHFMYMVGYIEYKKEKVMNGKLKSKD